MCGTGERIAVMAVGPHHISTNTRAPSGRFIAKHRLLAARGWAIVCVPDYVWAKLDHALQDAWLLQARHLFGAQSPACFAVCCERMRSEFQQVRCLPASLFGV